MLIAVGVLGFAAPAHAVIDMTGYWDVSITGGPSGTIRFVQNGTDLTTPDLGGTGTIDPDTGVFHETVVVFSGDFCGYVIDATTTADGQTFAGTITGYSSSCPYSYCLCDTSETDPISGVRSLCGNGTIDPGESCDDGNRSPGDCCDASCQLEPPGAICNGDANVCTDDVCDGAGTCTHPNNSAPCGSVCRPDDVCSGGTCMHGAPAPAGTPCELDFNVCTADACDGAGTCAGGSPVDCGPCRFCEPLANLGCIPAIRNQCLGSADGSSIILDSDPAARLRWTWQGTPPLASFGDPFSSTDYELCVFSPFDGLPEPVVAVSVPAGGVCGNRPCWTPKYHGVRYRSPGRSPASGLSSLTLDMSTAGTSRVRLLGKGPNLLLPPSLDLGSILVQLVATDRLTGQDVGCWLSSFTPGRSEPGRYQSRF